MQAYNKTALPYLPAQLNAVYSGIMFSGPAREWSSRPAFKKCKIMLYINPFLNALATASDWLCT